MCLIVGFWAVFRAKSTGPGRYEDMLFAPAFKQPQRLFIAAYGLLSELSALAVDHKLFYLPTEAHIGHKNTPDLLDL